MRIISLTQPWATLVAIGAKRFETRSWSTPYRGPIAIHAAKRVPKACVDLCAASPFTEALAAAGVKGMQELPLGAVIAVARLVAVYPTQAVDQLAVHFPADPAVLQHELAFGDYTDGRWAWALSDVKKLRSPVPWRGALGLRTVAPELAQRIQEAL